MSAEEIQSKQRKRPAAKAKPAGPANPEEAAQNADDLEEGQLEFVEITGKNPGWNEQNPEKDNVLTTYLLSFLMFGFSLFFPMPCLDHF